MDEKDTSGNINKVTAEYGLVLLLIILAYIGTFSILLLCIILVPYETKIFLVTRIGSPDLFTLPFVKCPIDGISPL
ncbi:MAG TPA: hypothetical protein PL169_27780, partial [Leptospiraceae bacterium]|nr:hypothetical protein [Leptospiraceae bacterium]